MGCEHRRIAAVFRRAIVVAAGLPPLALGCADAARGGAAPVPVPVDAAVDDATVGSVDSGAGADGDGGLGDAKEADAACAYSVIPSDPIDSCGDWVRLPCGLPSAVVPRDSCYLAINDCASICPNTYFNCHAINDSCTDAGVVVPDDAGGVTVDCMVCAVGVGRVPEGLAKIDFDRALSGSSAVAAYFARAAHFEAASVLAFRGLRADLARHDAPVRLVRDARRAERDEARHARLTIRASRSFGARAKLTPRVRARLHRDLEAVARENAVEGCIRETFGALMLHAQARGATEPALAALLARIARDETRHAALSWSVAAWATPKLTLAARARIAAACRDAVAQLRRAFLRDPDATLAEAVGLPTAARALSLLSVLEADLFPRLLAAA